MPIKKIDPHDERRTLMIKVAFVVLLGLVVMGANWVYQHSPREKTIPRNVLGTQTGKLTDEALKELTSGFDEVKAQLHTLSGQMIRQGEGFIEAHKDDVEKAALDAINKRTLDPILKQIDVLPDSQKEYIKKAICR